MKDIWLEPVLPFSKTNKLSAVFEFSKLEIVVCFDANA